MGQFIQTVEAYFYWCSLYPCSSVLIIKSLCFQWSLGTPMDELLFEILFFSTCLPRSIPRFGTVNALMYSPFSVVVYREHTFVQARYNNEYATLWTIFTSNRTANKYNINYANLSNHDAQKQAHDPQTLTVHIAHTAISTTRPDYGRTWYGYVHAPENSLSISLVLINLYELNFPMLVYLKNEEIIAQWNKIWKYKVKITKI